VKFQSDMQAPLDADSKHRADAVLRESPVRRVAKLGSVQIADETEHEHEHVHVHVSTTKLREWR
jgi:hypothetical protein